MLSYCIVDHLSLTGNVFVAAVAAAIPCGRNLLFSWRQSSRIRRGGVAAAAAVATAAWAEADAKLLTFIVVTHYTVPDP